MTTMSIRDKSLVIAAAVAVAIVAVAIAVLGPQLGADDHARSTSDVRSSGDTAGQGAGQLTTTVPDLKTDTVADLRSEGVIVDSLPATLAADAAKTTDLESAIATAQAEFPGMVKGQPGQAELMTLTIQGYGRETQPNVNKPSSIELKVANRPAWVLVFDAVDVPLVGAYNPRAEKDTLPELAPSRFVVLIDPATGTFVHARTF